MSLLSRLVGLVLCSALAVSASAFEGKVTLAMKGAKEKSATIGYAMKDGLLRMETQMEKGENAVMIFDYAKKEMLVLMPKEKMYMTMPIKSGEGDGQHSQGEEQKVEKTGKTDTILGYLCEQYITTNKKGESVELWVTDKLGTFMGLGGGGGGGMMGGPRRGGGDHGWEQLVKSKEGFFPLRVVTHDAKGKETFTLETKSIEPGALPDSLFSPPADFRSFQMPSFGDMMNPLKRN